MLFKPSLLASRAPLTLTLTGHTDVQIAVPLHDKWAIVRGEGQSVRRPRTACNEGKRMHVRPHQRVCSPCTFLSTAKMPAT